MRQRERTRAALWIKGLKVADGVNVMEHEGPVLHSVNELMHRLSGHFGRLLICWEDDGRFRVQVLPRTLLDGCQSAPGALSYRGEFLYHILYRALHDVLALKHPSVTWEGCIKEWVEWVA